MDTGTALLIIMAFLGIVIVGLLSYIAGMHKVLGSLSNSTPCRRYM